MDSSILAWVIPLATFIGGGIGWLVRQLFYLHEMKKQAGVDADKTLKDKKILLEELLSKTEENDLKKGLCRQLDEVNAALLGLCNERLRRTLKDAGLPPEKALITDGSSKLQPQQVAQLNKDIAEIQYLSPSASIEGLTLLAGAYYYANKYDKAKETWDEILKLDPNNFDALNNRGSTYGMTEKYNEALADYNHALALKPDNAEALSNRGTVYVKLKKYDEALTDYNRALALKPDDLITIYNISCIFSLQNKIDDALTYLEKAIRKEKKSKEKAKTDKDFENIRNDPRFKKLIEED